MEFFQILEINTFKIKTITINCIEVKIFMIFSKENFYIDSDFEIRIVREDENDVDLFIPIGNRTLNLYFGDTMDVLNSRMQFSIVRNLVLRFSMGLANNIATIHMLKNIDLHSSIVNFEINYSDHIIEIKDKEYFVEMSIKRKKAVDKPV